MNLYQLTPYLSAIAGCLFGLGITYWRYKQQIKLLQTQLKRQNITNQQLKDRHQSVGDQLHSLHHAHNRLNTSYNKLYTELDDHRNQLRQAKTSQNRYLDRIANQQAALQVLQQQYQALQQQYAQQGYSIRKGVQPMPKMHFSGRQKRETVTTKKGLEDSKDDLKKVKGISSSIEKALHRVGITTWVKLSHANVEELKQLLDRKGKQISPQYDPSTWPKQAALAAKGHWKELKNWQRRWEEQQLLNNLVK